MIEFSATIDRASFDRTINGLKAFDKARGLTVKFIAHDVMRAWVKDMMKYTAPWADNTPGLGLAQRDVGRGAVGKDLLGHKELFKNTRRTGVFREADGPAIERHWMWSTASRSKKTTMAATQTGYSQYAGKRGAKLVGGAILVIDEYMWRPEASMSEMEEFHKKYRNSRGRTTAAGSWSKDVGRWKPMGLMFVNKDRIQSYMHSVQKRVGSLKAGWLPALYHYASLSNGSVGKITQWIGRQSVRAGSFGGTMSDRGDGSIFSANTAHHSRAIRRDTVLYAQKKQERSMKAFGEKRVQRLCDQFNSGQKPVAQTRSAA